jgi:hypothetical protein
VNVTAVPTIPVVGPVIVTASASGVTVTECEALPVCAGVDVSVATRFTVNDPFVV